MTIVHELTAAKIINPPQFCLDNLCNLSICGSKSQGVSNEFSDTDLVGFCVPPQAYIYPPGIHGFDTYPVFEQFTNNVVYYKDEEYGVTIYSIVKLIKLASESNPNCLDFLSTPKEYRLHDSLVSQLIRAHNHLFLTKMAIPKFVGMAHSHFKSMNSRIQSGIYPEKRKRLYESHGFDSKDAGRMIQTLLTLVDVLNGDAYNIQKHAQITLDIRNGKFKYNEVTSMYQDLREQIKSLETTTKIPDKPDMVAIKKLLVDCLQMAGVHDERS